MTIEKRGNSYRITQMRDGIRYRLSVDHKPTKREAEEMMQEYIRTTSGMPQEGKGLSMGDACVAYIDLKSNVLSPNTIIGYRKVIKAMPDWFLSKKVEQITAIDVQKVINDKAAAVSAKTIRNYHGFISAVLAVYNPSLRISTTLPQKRKYEAITPSEDDIKKILNDVASSKFEIPFRLGCYGMRRGEICAISSRDLVGNLLTINKAKVYTEDGEWIIKPFPKTTESERTIYIDDDLANKLSDQGEAFSENPERLSKHLHSIQKRLGLPRFRFHDLRAYYATMAHSLGVPDAYIMAAGGWSSTNILNRVYKRTFSEKQNEINLQMAEKLSQF